MSSASSNPRRRAQKPTTSIVTPAADASSPTSMFLKKGDTFHSPTRLSSDLGNLSIANSPKRSYTSSQSLEDLVAGEQRVAEVINRVNKTLSEFHSTATGPNLLKDPEVLPLPSFMLDNTSFPSTNHKDDKYSYRRTRQADHSHGSDSGIGSSIGGSTLLSNSAASTVSSSAITKSHTAISNTLIGHALSQHAVKEIQLKIVNPILTEKSLEDFHSLVKEVPHRIGSKAITNLRDLEKTLIFLAPESSSSPDSYVQFCEFAVRCIHDTVPSLSEADQRLPADRPYTDGYFLDLVEQIRKYATIMAATREKEAKGEALDEMDFSPSEKLTLKGGVTQDGSPLELVREKDGKTIPLATNEERAAAASKRSVGEDSDDELAIRSMARRRKSEKPGDVVHVCRDCHKSFKRPCDLTKHEKTHSRPWKCPHTSCKYNEYGWPTEKEMDRHINDKHSVAPSLFKCRFSGCSYSSKRESNCKQHMEKAHGWTYVRSKSNGRRKGGQQQVNTDVSPAAPALSTPMTPFEPSPVCPPWNSSNSASHESLLPSNYSLFAGPEYTTGYNDNAAFGSEQGPFFNDLDMAMTGATNGPFGHTPAMSVDDRRGSHATSSNPPISSNPSPAEPTAFVDAFTPDQQPDLNLTTTEFDNNGFMFANGAMQQPTPATSVGPADINLNMNTNAYHANNMTSHVNAQHISPLSGHDVPFYSPANQMHLDEGFDEMAFTAPQGDFELFPPNTTMAGSLFDGLSNQNTTSMPYDSWNNYHTSNDTFNGGYGFNGQ